MVGHGTLEEGGPTGPLWYLVSAKSSLPLLLGFSEHSAKIFMKNVSLTFLVNITKSIPLKNPCPESPTPYPEKDYELLRDVIFLARDVTCTVYDAIFIKCDATCTLYDAISTAIAVTSTVYDAMFIECDATCTVCDVMLGPAGSYPPPSPYRAEQEGIDQQT